MANGWRYSLTFRGQAIVVPEGQSVLGRSRHVDVQIPEPSVSRKHLRVVTVHDAIVVEDLGASNGTYVNDAPIYGRTTVRHGDRLAIGDAELEVSITPIGPPETAQPADGPGSGHGAATMFLQQQSIDLALQVTGDSQPQDEISPEEALDALGQAFPSDDEPSFGLEEIPTQTAIPQSSFGSSPDAGFAAADRFRDLEPRDPASAVPSAEEAGQFATMAIDRSMFEDFEPPADLELPASKGAATGAAPHDETLPATAPPIPAPPIAAPPIPAPPIPAPPIPAPPIPAPPIGGVAPPESTPAASAHLASAPLAWREDTASEIDATVGVPPALSDAGAAVLPRASTESTTVSSAWDAMAFDAVETPPPVTNLATSATPAVRPLPAASLGLRALAWMVDLIWIAALGFTFWLGLGLANQPQGWQQAGLLGIGCGALITLVGWSLVGTTPGKRVLKLFVCTPEGQPGIGFLRAAIRGTVWVLSALPLGIGFLMAVMPSGRALHDRLAGTYVGRKAP